MLQYILRRLVLMVPTLIGVTAVVFFTMALSPGGVGGPMLNSTGDVDPILRQAMREYYNQRYGLDQPLLVQYGRWLNRVSPVGFAVAKDGSVRWAAPRVKMPDLGESMLKRRPVTDLYAEALPVTLLLNLVSTPIIYGVAIVSGIYMARHRGKVLDLGAGTSFLALWSLPVMWVGIMLIGFLASNQYLHWFPTGGLSSTFIDQAPFLPRIGVDNWEPGWLLDRLWHLVLPLICLIYGGFAVLAKLMRSSMLDTLNADYIRTARAKGVAPRDVLFRHAFRNSLLPLITVAAGILPGLLAGSVIIESIFSIPGMGKLTIDAINARDRELILAGTLIGGVIGLLCVLAADLAYAIADPRVSYD
jgi:ABC-type dipeptide/oligopeptide/nickel transport system permease component